MYPNFYEIEIVITVYIMSKMASNKYRTDFQYFLFTFHRAVSSFFY